MSDKAKKKRGAKAKLREFFEANVGQVLSSDALKAAADGKAEFARRIRELRNEEGMNIQTHNDRGDLKPGEYILLDLKRLPAFDRAVSKKARALVLERNGFTCQMCGAGAGEPHPHDIGRKTRLHIGHIIDKSMGGTDEITNLRAVCSICNEGASNVTPAKPEVKKVLAQIRKMSNSEQLEVLSWLLRKYPDEPQIFTTPS